MREAARHHRRGGRSRFGGLAACALLLQARIHRRPAAPVGAVDPTVGRSGLAEATATQRIATGLAMEPVERSMSIGAQVKKKVSRFSLAQISASVSSSALSIRINPKE